LQDKTLPKDFGEESLPGRFEESNPDYTDIAPKPTAASAGIINDKIISEIPEDTSPKPKSREISIAIILFAIFSVGVLSYYFINQDEIDSQIIQNMDPGEILANRYDIGEFGSDHTHAAIVVVVNGKQVNFGTPQFQLSSKYIHFENNNPYQIHKHATNVPLGMLFASFGVDINCITVHSEPCKDSVVYVNGEPYHSDISQYEIDHDDRILISIGEQSVVKHLKYLDSLKIFDTPQNPNSGKEIFI